MSDLVQGIYVLVLVMAIILLIAQARSQERLARMERKLNAVLRHFAIDPVSGIALSDRVKELARDPSKKIEAIKALREETGTSLVAAKTAVEDYQSSL